MPGLQVPQQYAAELAGALAGLAPQAKQRQQQAQPDGVISGPARLGVGNTLQLPFAWQAKSRH